MMLLRRIYFICKGNGNDSPVRVPLEKFCTGFYPSQRGMLKIKWNNTIKRRRKRTVIQRYRVKIALW